MEIIRTPKAPAAVGPYSQAVKAGGFLFCSGQIGLDPETGKPAGDDIKSQTTQVLNNISEVLKASGLELKDVVKTTVYLLDMEDFSIMNDRYEKTFQGHKPSRSTVEVSRLPMNSLVEIECIACFS